jgi:hypothetical protein
MDDNDLKEALRTLYAYESGARVELPDLQQLRARCQAAIQDQLFNEDVNFRVWFSCLVRDMYLSDAALTHGTGIEDALEFWNWFDGRMWSGEDPEPDLAAAS